VDSGYYNSMVNIANEELNPINFLESLQYKGNALRLISILKKLESIFESAATIYPSFKGSTVIEGGSVELSDEEESFFEVMVFSFDEYHTKDILDSLTESPEIHDECTKIVFSESADVLRLYLCTERFLELNQEFDGCEFFVEEI